jgi:hypothetical protein
MARGSVAFPNEGWTTENKREHARSSLQEQGTAVIRIARDVLAFASMTAFTSVVSVAALLLG